MTLPPINTEGDAVKERIEQLAERVLDLEAIIVEQGQRNDTLKGALAAEEQWRRRLWDEGVRLAECIREHLPANLPEGSDVSALVVEAARQRDELLDALGTMLHGADNDFWAGRASQLEACREVYRRLGGESDGC